MVSSIPQPPSPIDTRSRSSSIAESGSAKQSRTSRACEGCRRRKVKCSGGAVCETCAKFNETCNYRKHYRALKGYPIKMYVVFFFKKKNYLFKSQVYLLIL